MDPSTTAFRTCYGLPTNEDQGCSDGLVSKEPCVDVVTCICYHTHYFNIEVGEVCGGNVKPCSCCT